MTPASCATDLKIESTIDNAKAYLALSKHTPFAHFIWSFIDGQPQQNKLDVDEGRARLKRTSQSASARR